MLFEDVFQFCFDCYGKVVSFEGIKVFIDMEVEIDIDWLMFFIWQLGCDMCWIDCIYEFYYLCWIGVCWIDCIVGVGGFVIFFFLIWIGGCMVFFWWKRGEGC